MNSIPLVAGAAESCGRCSDVCLYRSHEPFSRGSDSAGRLGDADAQCGYKRLEMMKYFYEVN